MADLISAARQFRAPKVDNKSFQSLAFSTSWPNGQWSHERPLPRFQKYR
jgi:hypothetical protein